MDFNPEEMARIADHRETACKAVQPCKSCGSEQVQLTFWLTDTCRVKCRHCGYRDEFTHPDAVNK